jgi:RNA polymerase sigma-70 factor (ECF subfamily)
MIGPGPGRVCPGPDPSPLPMDSDPNLVERAKAGDYRAFETLLGRHEARLYSLARGILRQREDAENVVQSSFLSAIEHLGEFRGESSFGTWIARIATHGALNALRKRRGLPTVSYSEASRDDDDGAIPHPEFIADWRGDPARIVEQAELRRILDEAIDGLDEKHRVVFVLRDVEGLSVAETARTLGLGESNVKVRLLRARMALREKLTRIFGDPSSRVAPHDHSGGIATSKGGLRAHETR